MSPRFEPITGRYLHLDLLGKPHRLYVEEAGQGIPLLCLHTAGSDGAAISRPDERRAHHGELSRHRLRHALARQVVAARRAGRTREYQLTSRDYVRMIVEVADALGLDKPVAMGCSIGGRIVLHLAHEYPSASAR